MHYEITEPDDLERVIAELELIKKGKPVSPEELKKIRDLKSGAVIIWDILRKTDVPVEVSERGHYTIGLIEEIGYRNPQSPVHNDPFNLIYAACAYKDAGRKDLAVLLLDEFLGEHAEKHPKLREYAQKMKDELTSEQ